MLVLPTKASREFYIMKKKSVRSESYGKIIIFEEQTKKTFAVELTGLLLLAFHHIRISL